MRAALIEQSLEIAAARCPDLTPLVYERLFREQPQMQALFWRDSNGAIKGEMLARVFEAILDFVGERLYAHHLIQCEVVTHDGYDVPPPVFATFFGIVSEVIQDACGGEWTEAMDQAWRIILADLDDYVTHP